MRPNGFQTKEFTGEKLISMVNDNSKHFSSFETDGGNSTPSSDMYSRFVMKKNRALVSKSKNKRLNPFENIDSQGALQCQLSSVFMLEDILIEQKKKRIEDEALL